MTTLTTAAGDHLAVLVGLEGGGVASVRVLEDHDGAAADAAADSAPG